jgi:hypothetical protein
MLSGSIAPVFSLDNGVRTRRLSCASPGVNARQRQSLGVDDRMRLACRSISRIDPQLFSVAGNTRHVLVYAHNRRIDHLYGHIMSDGNAAMILSQSFLPLASERSDVAGGVSTKVSRQIALGSARMQYPKETVETSSTRGTPRGLFGSNGLYGGPLIVSEFLAHVSRLRVKAWITSR